MKNSNVNTTMARDLNNTKPMFDFRSPARLKPEKGAFDNNKYLKAVKVKAQS